MLEKQKGNQVRNRVTRTRRKKTLSIRADKEENGSREGHQKVDDAKETVREN